MTKNVTLNGQSRVNGLIDEVTLYKRALPASEIQAVFQAGNAGKCNEQAHCEADRDQCQADLSQCSTNLATSNANLAFCNTSLAQANTALANTQALLVAATADADEDGIPDRFDHCTGTALSAAVDSEGCSLAQFCGAVTPTTVEGRKTCLHLDWQNDEPNLSTPEDCTVRRGGAGHSALCVPAF